MPASSGSVRNSHLTKPMGASRPTAPPIRVVRVVTSFRAVDIPYGRKSRVHGEKRFAHRAISWSSGAVRKCLWRSSGLFSITAKSIWCSGRRGPASVDKDGGTTVQVSRDWRQWCLFGASVFVVIWLYSQDSYDALKFFLFFVVFNCLPGLALLELLFPRWRNLAPPALLLIAFAPVGGLIFLLPWWAANMRSGYFLIPIAALLLLFATSRARAVAVIGDQRQWPQLPLVAVALLGTIVVAFALTWKGTLHDHLLIQAAMAVKLDTGYRPEWSFIAGVPLAYNYAAHIWLAASSSLTGIPLENVVVYAAPALLLYCSVAALAALGYYAGLRGWIVALIVCCAFCYAGTTPIGGQLFARAITWSAVVVIGPLLAFSAALVLVMALSDWFSTPVKQREARTYVFAFLVMLVVVGSRAPGAIVVLGGVAFLVACEIAVQKRLNFSSLGMLAVLVVTVGFGLVAFLGYGTSFHPDSFTTISATPFPYLARYEYFWMPALLIANGVAPDWAGALQFAVLAILQAGFLTPFLIWRLFASRRSYSPLEVLLFGAAVAGLAAIFFLESQGGSHFTFLHYSTIAFSLLGGIALSEVVGARTRAFYAAAAIAGVLAIVQIVEIPFRALSGMVLRLAPVSSPERSIARRCPGEPDRDLTNLVAPAGATVVLARNVEFCQRLRFIIRNPRADHYLEEWLRPFAEWETSFKPALTAKVALLDKGPAVLAASLPAPSYVLVHKGAELVLERHDAAR